LARVPFFFPKARQMTTTYDPDHPAYGDEADVRAELTRVYDLCHGCRLCLSLCPSFPTMFDLIDAKDGDVAALTPAEQDRVVDECYQCKLCYVKCPYVPPHEWQLDFPRLMQRAVAARPKTARERITTQALARTDQSGRLGSLAAPLANAAIGRPGSAARKLMDKAVGIAAERLLPPYARTRFSTWFRRRRPQAVNAGKGRVAVFPTCLVEYQNPAVGQDLVAVYEHNGIRCDLPDGLSCCGAPWLHSSDFDHFRRQAARNVRVLADAVRAGHDIVVPQPTCGYVLKRDYPEYLDSDDARLVGSHTYDAAEYLWRLHKSSGISYHAPCHLQAQQIGLRSRDLLKLTGAQVTTVAKCSGIDGTWGLRSENYELARKVAQPLRDALTAAGAEVVAGDCQLANGAITQETGAVPQHPLQVLARAYGLPSPQQP
jgi:glycerol-3-phosphate dehydrogenase subunit C